VKKLNLSVFISLFLLACASTKHEAVSFCFDSQSEAKNVGKYMLNHSFTHRVRYWLDGQNKSIEGLGFYWAGFKPDGSCPADQFQLKIVYEPKNKTDLNVKEIMNVASMTYKLMRKEYNAL